MLNGPKEASAISPGSIPLTLPEPGLSALFGVQDESLRILEEAFGVEISARGREVSLTGEPAAAALAARLLSQFGRLLEKGWTPKKTDLVTAIRIVKENPDASLVEFFFDNSAVGPSLRQV